MRVNVSVLERKPNGRLYPLVDAPDYAADIITDLSGAVPGSVENAPEGDSYIVGLPVEVVQEHTNAVGTFYIEGSLGAVSAFIPSLEED